MRKITTLKAFKAFLKRYGIDFSKWGEGPTKTVERLFYEYSSGESQFVIRKKRLIRVVTRVQVLVYYRSKKGIRYFLIEKRQVFANGSTRKRSRRRSLSEKMPEGEQARAAALRAAKEEIGVTGLDAAIFKRLKSSSSRKPAFSDSYRGLLTIHKGPRFRFNLPAEHYKAAGYDEVQPDKTTEFRWKKLQKRK